MIKNLKVLGAMLIFAVSSNVVASDWYAGARLFSAETKYDNTEFINPRITGFKSGNGNQRGVSGSLMIGRYIKNTSARVELEYANYPSKTYTSYWNPFPNYQKVTVGSKYLMVNILYDHAMKHATLFAGGGIGIAQNKSSAEQETQGSFSKNTNTNFAYSLTVGASKSMSDKVDVELAYKYVVLGNANTGISQFALKDEQFKGKLKSTQISLGLRFKF